MANAKIEMERKDDFDFNIVNDDLERAFKELESVFKSILKGNS
jgi:guanylate kinase